jgi:flagellar biosynthesis protein FlhG
MMHDQAERLREIFLQKKNIKEATTIAVLSGKGGVGKSNFALNFSLGLAKQNKKVLLFDLDFGMGNIDILMGLTPRKTIVHLFEESVSISDIIEKGPNNLSYVAAGSSLEEIFNMSESDIEYFLNQLRSISMEYDYIIFDLGAGFQEHHLRFALAAHECIIVTTTEPTSITDAYAVLKLLYLEEVNHKLFILVNRVNSMKEGEETFRRIKRVVKSFLNRDVYRLGYVYEDRTVVQAVKEQNPFILKYGKSLASKSIKEVIQNYLSITEDAIFQQPSHSFITKLKMLISRKVE